MHTIYDYLLYHKDISLSVVSWNDIDNLLCAMLAYLPTAPFAGKKTLKELYLEAKQMSDAQKTNAQSPDALKLLESAANSKRYKDLKVYNFVQIKNNSVQFGAVTFRIKNETIISFMGTDYSLSGWFENFRLSYEYPTKTQILAKEYLKLNLRFFENKNIHVVGHSKGGNLAMSSVMEQSERDFRRIKRVLNFDGPGFKTEEFRSEKYKKLKEKLVNILPDVSLVGVLLNNENYTVVKTESSAVNKHNPVCWNVFGSFFVPSHLSVVSAKLRENSTIELEKISIEQRKQAFLAIFQSFEEEHKQDFKMSLQNMIRVYKNIKNLEPDTVKCIDAIINAILKVQLFNKNSKD